MSLGVRTVISPSPSLAESKAWFTALLGGEPYVDETINVGYGVNGYGLALDPNAEPERGPTTY